MGQQYPLEVVISLFTDTVVSILCLIDALNLETVKQIRDYCVTILKHRHLNASSNHTIVK